MKDHHISFAAAAFFLLVAVVLFAWSAWVVNPVEEGADHLPSVLGLTESKCPDGWKHPDPEVAEHAIVNRCERGGWVVFLDEQGEFSHAGKTDASGFIVEFVYEEEHVPAWPASD